MRAFSSPHFISRPTSVRPVTICGACTLSAPVDHAASPRYKAPLATLSAGLPVALGGGHVDMALRSRDVWTGVERAEEFGCGRSRPGFCRRSQRGSRVSLGGHGEFLGLPLPMGGVGRGELFINTQPALVVVDPMFPNNPDPFPVLLLDSIS